MFYSTKEFVIRNTNDVEEESGGGGIQTGDDDLIISEYVEGSSYNKYLEIFNAGTGNADLSKYVVELYKNGDVDPSYSAEFGKLTGLTSLSANSI